MKQLAWGSVLLVFAFLAGYLPQRSTITQLRGQVSTVQQDLASCHFKGKLAEIRDLAALMYLESSQKNYSVASGYATRFFNHVRDLLNESEGPSPKQSLQELLDVRDAIISGLATGDPAVVNGVQNILIKVHKVGKS